MRRHKLNSVVKLLALMAGCLVGLAYTLTIPQTAGAQTNPYRIKERYDKAKHGRSIFEWTRRLQDDDPVKRLDAVKSLADSGESAAIQYLVQATGDPDMRVKIKAIDSLGKLRATAATQVLVQYLFLRKTEPRVKQRILVALGMIADPRATDPILEYLKQNLTPEAKGTAIFSLGEIGSPKALADLKKVKQSSENPQLRLLASEAIAKINHRVDPPTVEVKIPALAE